ncbi:hypothetical protein GE09DRAFT_446731 [Coniochaeta sp. 2T2.1]|nr:hypothetical protein GE09DRAFT_446731 [Coniochaeta sp. 2T2.1]
MLKTTTETGDIGVYSVRPSRSASHARAPLQPKSNSAANVLARSMSVNATDNIHFRDDRRGLPSYRDTTSEIISLYGHRSRRGPHSRSPEDPAPRSYSLTSCSSRYPSDQKSTRTWDSRSSGGSGGVLARPRSPYPYHTRLKRPGVRPSSPALTMDGSIDYTRMVEIDRPSYRTVHRSYNRPYPPNPPRQPYPLPRHRPFIDGYMPRSPPGDAEAFALSRHGSAATPCHPLWASRDRDQADNRSSDQSAGVSSITSIVQMYGPPPPQPAVPQPPLARNGSFYYDYSEDFQVPTMTVPCEPVSPMPSRVRSMARSTVLDDGCEPGPSGRRSTDEATDNEDSSLSPLTTTHFRESKEHPPETLVSAEGVIQEVSVEVSPQAGTLITDKTEIPRVVASDNPAPGSSPIGAEEAATHAAGDMDSEEDVKIIVDAAVRVEDQTEESSVIDGIDRSDSTTTASEPSLASKQSEPQCPDTGDSVENAMPESPSVMPETPSAVTDSPASRDSKSTKRDSEILATPSENARRRSNVYSLQPGLLDLKTFVQDLDDAGLLHDTDVSGSYFNNSSFSNTPVKMKQGADVHAVLARTKKVLEAEADRITGYRDAGKPALPSAVSRLKTNAISDRRQSTDGASSVILAPLPVSPARQLRLRSSVSKLMKALPPFPDTPDSSKLQPAGNTVAEHQLPDLPPVPRLSLSGGPGPAVFTSVPVKADNVDKTTPAGASHKKSSNDLYGDMWDMHFRKSDDRGAAVVGRKSVNEIGPDMLHQAEEDMHANDGFSGQSANVAQPMSQRGKLKSSTMRSRPVGRDRVAQLNSIPQARGTSLDTSRTTFRAPPVPSKDPINIQATQQTSSACHDVRTPRGLRKRLSDFKIQLTESRHRAADWSSPGTQVHENGEIIGVAVPVTSSAGSPESGGHKSNSNSATDDASARGLRYKISRWMKSAKHAVNACKRLSSSTAGTSVDTDF